MKSRRSAAVSVAGAAFGVLSALAVAQETNTDFKGLYEAQTQRNVELERRIRLIEEHNAQDLYLKKESVPEPTLSFLESAELGGLISSSYFYNFNEPENRENAGRGFDNRHNEFMLNKAVLAISKPAEYNAFDWQSGYTAKFFIGQDARYTMTDLSVGDFGDLFEANLTVNVPVGNGLKVSFGKYGTPMGYEASFTEENSNWSGGLQWALLEPFTHTGVRATYALNAQWEFEVCAFNGWDIVQDNNSAKSYMAHVSYTPREATTLSLIGYGGPEQEGNDSNWRRGVDFYIQQKLTRHLTCVAQVDWGMEGGAAAAAAPSAEGDLDSGSGEVVPADETAASEAAAEPGTAEWWGGGLWLIYEPSEKWSVALRGDYVNDVNGVRSSGVPAPAPLPENDGAEFYSVTLTLNEKPTGNLRIAPEFRWDRSTLDNAFDGRRDQTTLGVGAAFAF